jgi:hypothetical protein
VGILNFKGHGHKTSNQCYFEVFECGANPNLLMSLYQNEALVWEKVLLSKASCDQIFSCVSPTILNFWKKITKK